jgi:PAS domain S-box-containing protein/putative nucleotidyltransferase with HDIG domain
MMYHYYRNIVEADRIKERSELEERFRLLAETIYEGICIVKGDSIIEADEGFSKVLGYSVDEIVGKHVWDFSLPEKIEESKRMHSSQPGPPREAFAIKKDGSIIKIEMVSRKQSYKGEVVSIVGIRDITEYDQTRAALKRINEQQRRLIETVKHLTTSMDLFEVLNKIASGAKEVVKAHGCSLYRLEENGKVLTPLIALEPIHADILMETPLDVYNSFTGQSVRNRKGIIVNHTMEHEGGQYINGTEEREDECMIAVPLIFDDKVNGAMTLNRYGEFFCEEDLSLAETFAAYASAALSNTELIESLRLEINDRKLAEHDNIRHLDQLNALRSIDLAITNSLDISHILNVLTQQTVEQLRVDAADIMMLKQHTNILECASQLGFKSPKVADEKLYIGQDGLSLSLLNELVIDFNQVKQFQQNNPRPALKDENFVFHYAAPLLSKGHFKGLLEVFHRTPLEPNQEWWNFFETLAGQAAIAIDNTQLFDGLQQTNTALMLSYDATLEGWARALELRDQETVGHSNRVTEMTMALAKKLDLHESELVHIKRGALLHDIGKMGIPDHILHKPGPLNEAEWQIMKQHPIYAYEMLSPIPYLHPALHIPYCHHEKWDGTGYPRGLKGEEIPLPARIFALVDVWDALLSERPYRDAWELPKAIEYIKSQENIHFDPLVLNAFLEILEKDERFRNTPK